VGKWSPKKSKNHPYVCMQGVQVSVCICISPSRKLSETRSISKLKPIDTAASNVGARARVYPKGVSQAQTSDRVKGLAVMLYLLGLSYGAVSLALESLGVPLSRNGSLQHGARDRPTHPRNAHGRRSLGR
jgi:hypothetical protein